MLSSPLTRSPNRALRQRRRFRLLGAIAIALGSLAIPSAFEITPRVIYNASASAPLGLYWAHGRDGLERGEFVLANLPKPVRQLANDRGYLPVGVPLIKRVAAVPGDHICIIGRAVLIDAKLVARRQNRDSQHRLVPAWHGCRRLTAGEIFLLMSDVPDSFDGRYFGPSRITEVIGRLTPIWTWRKD